MAETTKLGLPYIMAAQAQKHVTHNDAIRLLDGIVQLSVVNRTETAPPGGAGDGDCYIVGDAATGEWAGWDGDIAMRADGAWYRLPAGEGWRAWDEDAATLIVRTGGSWEVIVAGGGFIARAPQVDIAEGAMGATTGIGVLEEELSGLSGADATSMIMIPDRAIVLGVSSRTTATITGAASYDCGIAGEASKFGGSLGVAAGNTNKGVIGPQAFYADTPIVLTANGAAFTGGTVRIAIHYLTVGLPNA